MLHIFTATFNAIRSDGRAIEKLALVFFVLDALK
jgi:hypothetical protein